MYETQDKDMKHGLTIKNKGIVLGIEKKDPSGKHKSEKCQNKLSVTEKSHDVHNYLTLP